jgi:hypothetical protein
MWIALLYLLDGTGVRVVTYLEGARGSDYSGRHQIFT